MPNPVRIHTSILALYGNHIYVRVEGDGKRFEYRAIRGYYDARSFVERILAKHFPGRETVWDGDVQFYYGREGD